MVLSWILKSIEKSLVNSLIYCNIAIDVWVDLEAPFSQSNNPRIFKLKRDIATLSQETLSVAAYYNIIKAYWDELGALQTTPLCSCGAIKELHTRN